MLFLNLLYYEHFHELIQKEMNVGHMWHLHFLRIKKQY